MNSRMKREYRGEGRFNENIEEQIRTPKMEGFQQRERENGISKRPQADQENPGDPFEFLMQAIPTVHIRSTLRATLPAIRRVAAVSNLVSNLARSVCGPGHQTRASREAGSASHVCHDVAPARDARV
jgi:hypothetical protein